VGVAIVTASGNYGNPIGRDVEGPAPFPELMAEPFIRGKELTTAVLGDKALMVTELIPTTEFYDFDAKYTDGLTACLPRRDPRGVAQACKDIALRAHQLLGCRAPAAAISAGTMSRAWKACSCWRSTPSRA
jgi:D-alanine-D-alanine ligase